MTTWPGISCSRRLPTALIEIRKRAPSCLKPWIFARLGTSLGISRWPTPWRGRKATRCPAIGAGRLRRGLRRTADAVARQEGDPLPGDRAKHIGVAGSAKRRAQLDPLALLQPFHGIQAAAADHADSCLGHVCSLRTFSLR